MKFLFLYAHPDDETIGAGGTIKLLTDQGHQVRLVSATDGSAGEISEAARPALAKFGTLGALRRHEFSQVRNLLGVSDSHILSFGDGLITNQQVWHDLQQAFITEIDTYQPDVVITFDHTGWYYHLDHVGVSIAATLAVQSAHYRPDIFFHNHFRVDSEKWRYVYSDRMPVTHAVDVTALKDIKFKAMDLHQSQNLTTPRNHIAARYNAEEFFQLVSSTPAGESWLAGQNLFKQISE